MAAAGVGETFRFVGAGLPVLGVALYISVCWVELWVMSAQKTQAQRGILYTSIHIHALRV